MQCTLERRQAEQNVFRFYRQDQGLELFGTACVTRNWRCIGTQGHKKIEVFDTPAEALRAVGRLTKAKRSRGYIDVTAAP